MFHHGLPLRPELAHLSAKMFGPVHVTQDELGLFVETALNMADEYEAAIGSLVRAGKLRWSSGTASHLIVREPESGKLLRWHPVEWSYTPKAAEPRLPTIAPLKALEDVTYTDLEAEPEEAVATVSADAGHVQVDVHVHLHNESMAQERPITTEEPEMDENKTETPTVDVAAIAKQAATEAVKAYQEELAKQPPVKTAGVVITDDAADRALKASPYKSLGEFLLDVAQAGAHGIMPDRLKPLRGDDPMDENGFNMGKALGDNFVGSLTNAAYRRSVKAPYGLNEATPSQGGFLVDTDRAAGILSRVYDVGQLLQRVDMVGISAASNGMTFYAEDETSRVAGSRRGGIRAYWAAEAGEKTKSMPTFRELELKLRKVIGLVYATDELLADASALESWILRNLPEELRFTVEDAIINGTGVGMPLGILNSGALVTVAKEANQAADTVVSQNVMKMWSRRWVPGRDYVWLVNQDVGPQLWQMSLAVGTGGLPVYLPAGGLTAQPYATLFNRPVLEVEYAATVGDVGDILLVSLSEYQMIEKGGIAAASSIHTRFVYDETAFRFVYRVDGQSKWNSTLTPFKGSNTVSPFVALAAR